MKIALFVLALVASSAQAQSAIEAYAAELHAMPRDEFCGAYGEAMRGDALREVPALKIRAVEAEAKSRGMKLDGRVALGLDSVPLGSSTCQVFLKLGRPKVQNRSVGPWGVHVQHVFDNEYFTMYAYTSNGKLTSFQYSH